MLHQICSQFPSVIAWIILMQSYRFLEHNEIQTCILSAVATANSAENDRGWAFGSRLNAVSWAFSSSFSLPSSSSFSSGKSSQLVLPVICAAPHPSQWPPRYQAVLRFSPCARISPLLPPCLGPGTWCQWAGAPAQGQQTKHGASGTPRDILWSTMADTGSLNSGNDCHTVLKQLCNFLLFLIQMPCFIQRWLQLDSGWTESQHLT